MPTQTDETLLQQVAELASSMADIPAANISPDSSFHDDLGFDSLDDVEFIMAVEEQFDIDVPDEIASEIKTISQAVDKIEQALAAKS